MCGIIGTINWHPSPNIEDITRATNAIAHRGPDDAGYWIDTNVALGFRRLSIIDLSVAGRQPMPNEDKTLRLVFNGEIYNYLAQRKALIQRGHVFRSHTDSECVLHGYEEWGGRIVEQLRGMFAFALWDQRNRTLTLARDRLGIKPLYYYWDGRRFAFASEIKALITLPQIDLITDDSALWDYLTYLYIPCPKTIYEHIRQVPPGFTVTYQAGEQPQLAQYWDIHDWGAPVQCTDYSTLPEWSTAVKAVHNKLCEAVEMHLLADVPVGLLLSGGLDSSTVAALATAAAPTPLKTFSIGFDVDEHTELPYARKVASHFRTEHFDRICSSGSLEESLQRMLELYDQPFADSSGIPTLAVSELAATQVKVVLSGDGGDEVFAGYKWHRAYLARPDPSRIQQWVYKSILMPALQGIASWPKVTGLIGRYRLDVHGETSADRYGALLSRVKRFQKPRLLPELARAFHDYDDYWHYRKYWREELDPISRIQYVDLKTYLPDDILTKVDRASMATSLEVRPPLLDHELVELVAKLPPEFRFGKRVLRAAIAQQLPAEIISRPKKGFSAPMLHWLQPVRRNGTRLGGLARWSMELLDAWERG